MSCTFCSFAQIWPRGNLKQNINGVKKGKEKEKEKQREMRDLRYSPPFHLSYCLSYHGPSLSHHQIREIERDVIM
jgi:tRNA U38,U39,U40 pseudouridine synthase TruA